MFRIAEDPSSGRIIQYLAKITRMNLSCPLTWTWSVLWQHILTRCACVFTHTHNGSETCWNTFKYFIILIVSASYVFVH